MMTAKNSRVTIAGASVAALLLAACGNGDNGNGEDGQAAGGGTVSVYNCEPQEFTPGNSTEVCGSKMLEQLFTGLTTVDLETYEVAEGVATNWDSNDEQTVWTFEIGEDWTFHNGDPITAQTFVDTFNWTVDPENAQAGAGFYDVFAGYEDVVSGDADELEGVRAVDDYTLEFELEEPFSPLPLMLSYTAFYPVPDQGREDPDAFESSPIGNGEYQMDGEWVHDVEVNMDRYEDYPLGSSGGPDRVEWRIYNDVETAYRDVQAGQLDILEQTPPNLLPQVDADFGDNQATFETASYEYFGFPLYQEEFQDPDVRHALSMAIDREQIIETIFDGARTPANNIIPPTLPQAREDACEYCEFDPDAAAELYEEAGGPSELTYYFNSGAGHEDYVEAIANMWQEHLPIDDVSFQSLEFAQYLDLQEEENITGPYRLGWSLSYPSPQYAMEPIYLTGAASNYFGYSSDEFDSLIKEANATDPEEADEIYQQAEDVLLEDMPGAPLWFGENVAVHTDRIDNSSVLVDQRSFLRVEQLVVTD
ncbi:ABC transporter substrate-binding protein [Auritidibacter ignavus]|uniref:peptide ABC transporter substrate-binding protein n=1 Tax=Auritidibacter ignavus TaxID=678932 RepID=UPI00244AAC79|nr:ABC transporter substrate-binding protein [Auritidibacter ignavus]WGH81101.1 ABC transporter substrate-binding protein [Auritidibacter ignavus]WHS35878.1 ABC transporter substrate-binding protein [Auritidibacter ignavus]